MSKLKNFFLGKPLSSSRAKDSLYGAIDNHVYSSTKEEMNDSLSTVRQGDKILREIEKIKSLLNDNDIGFLAVDKIKEMSLRLEKSGFCKKFISNFFDELEKKSTIKNLNDADYLNEAIKSYIHKRLCIYGTQNTKKKNRGKQRKIVLIGPSGAGKTTMLFKLASFFEEQASELDMKVANLDNQKVASKESFDKVREYMDLDGGSFMKIDDFQNYTKQTKATDLLLIDTRGINYSNNKDLLEMRNNLSTITEKSEVFLVIPANLSEIDIENLLEQFKSFHYDAVIISKLDESWNAASLISACVDLEVPIAFLGANDSYADGVIQASEEVILEYFRKVI